MSKKISLRSQKKCQICNKIAVGFHYGAYVCEACKKFFVRHVSGTCRLFGSCQKKAKCNLNIEGRGKCQHCRYRRCKEIGMNIDLKGSDYNLTEIPCQVCGGRSSGLHFGCITCEGCKGFFRRMIKCKGSLVCFNDNKCALDVKSRSNCKSCRLKRCLSVGMSRKGIRIGRHTNSLKYTCFTMLKKEESPESVNESVSDVEDTVSLKSENIKESMSCGQNEQSFCKIEKLQEDDDENEEEKEEKGEEDNDDVISPIETDSSLPIEQLSENCLNLEDAFENDKNEEMVLSDSFPSTSEAQVEVEVDNTKEELTDKPHISKIDITFSEASIFLTQNTMKIKFTGMLITDGATRHNMKSVLRDNDSSQIIWSKMMDHFVFHSQFIVKFVKLMPGFSHLLLEDKKTIIKDAMYPMILLELSQDYYEDEDDFYYNYFDFSPKDRQTILKYFPEFYEFSIHVQKTGFIKSSLRLDGHELTLMCGIMMFFNYRNLENWMYGKSMILLYQEYLHLYFRSQLKLSTSDATSRQERCMDFVSVLNDMNIQHQNIVINFCAKHTELQYPDLYIEVFKH